MKYFTAPTKWITFLFSIIPTLCFGELIECPQRTLTHVFVQGDRDDGHPYANKLVIWFDEPCDGKTQAYVDNNHPSYNSLVSIVLTAFTTDRKVVLHLNNSKTSAQAVELSIVTLLRGA